MNDKERPASPAETRAEITRLSARGYTQLRGILVQLPERDKPRASTVSKMLSGRRHRALLLYILVLTAWPWLKDRREPLPASVWIRALTAKGAPTWSPSTLSRAWADLEELGLISRKREGRVTRIVPRREDGAEDYEVPGGRQDRWNAYFALPDQFWNEKHFAQFSLPALVMLLVVLKETNSAKAHEVWLAYDHADAWYGIKAKSAQNGLKELDDHGFLIRRRETITAPLSPTGKTTRIYYSLHGPYSQKERAALRAKAAKAVKARDRTVTAAAPSEAAA